MILIVAYIVCRDDVDVDDLKARAKRRLPDYMVPNHFERIDAMPLTSSGKADRKALPYPSIATHFARR